MSLSIITVSYNCVAQLIQTAESVLRSHYNELEYIVIDGASSDGTQEALLTLASKFEDRGIPFFGYSKPDNGIYDAMNKGIKCATMRYITFLNCGDTISNPDSLSEIFAFANNADLIYCYTKFIFPSNEKPPFIQRTPEDLKTIHMRKGMAVCHQGVIAKRNLCSFYDLQYPIMSDYDWLIKILLMQPNTYMYKSVFVCYLLGGESAKHFSIRWRDRWRLVFKYFHIRGIFVNIPIFIYDYAYWHSNLFRSLIEFKRTRMPRTLA